MFCKTALLGPAVFPLIYSVMVQEWTSREEQQKWKSTANSNASYGLLQALAIF